MDSNSTYHNRLLIGFVRSNSPRMVVYLKQCDETLEYAVKVKHPDGARTIQLATMSLSSALRELAETIAQFTGGFSMWDVLE